MARTLSAMRQALYAAMTTPALTYSDATGQHTLPAANVIPDAIWNTGGDAAPSPLVSFVVAGRGVASDVIDPRLLEITITVAVNGSNVGYIVTDLYESIRARLVSSSDGPSALSRAATGATLGIGIAQMREMRVLPASFDASSQRTYLTATFAVVAL